MDILVVDDKPLVLTVLTRLLTGIGYNVVTACNGLDGFEKAQQGSFQLFIIDHLMPVMNGAQLAKNLKQTKQTALTPIIFMTTQDVSRIAGIDEAVFFDSIIAKPIDNQKLLSFIEKLVDLSPLYQSL